MKKIGLSFIVLLCINSCYYSSNKSNRFISNCECGEEIKSKALNVFEDTNLVNLKFEYDSGVIKTSVYKILPCDRVYKRIVEVSNDTCYIGLKYIKPVDQMTKLAGYNLVQYRFKAKGINHVCWKEYYE